MKLADVMGSANLALYAEIALVIFFLVFLLIVWRVVRGKEHWHRTRRLPLDDADERIAKDDEHG